MEHLQDHPCEASGCNSEASKHVRFGFRIFEPELAPTFHELDLCDSHIADINKQFLFINESDLKDRERVFKRSA